MTHSYPRAGLAIKQQRNSSLSGQERLCKVQKTGISDSPFSLQFSSLLLTVIICTLDVCRTLRAIKSWGTLAQSPSFPPNKWWCYQNKTKERTGRRGLHTWARGRRRGTSAAPQLPPAVNSDSVTAKTRNWSWNFDHIVFTALSSLSSPLGPVLQPNRCQNSDESSVSK